MSSIITRKINATQLGIKMIYPTDTFVVSYPKSGNTWMRFIIANMLTEDLVTMKNLNSFVPGIYNFKKKINSQNQPRVIKTHHCYLDKYPKSIYVYRDYRDVLVSYFHFQKSQDLFKGTITEFIRDKQLETFGSWRHHLQTALDFKTKYPQRVALISYQSLLENSIVEIEKIAAFLQIKSHKTYKEIAELCSFESLQSNEQQHGKVFNETEFNFFRKGTNRQYVDELSSADLEFILEKNREIMTQFNML